MKEVRGDFKFLSGKPAGKRPPRRPGRRWKYNIRIDFKQIDFNTRNWIDSAKEIYEIPHWF